MAVSFLVQPDRHPPGAHPADDQPHPIERGLTGHAGGGTPGLGLRDDARVAGQPVRVGGPGRLIENPYRAVRELCLAAGINHEGINAEVAKGQWEFQIFGKGSKKAADEMWIARYLLLRLTEKYGIDIEFHCKPLGDTDWNGSGMHCHMSIWKSGEPLFADASGYAGLSQMCKWYIGGLLRHAPAILAFAAPTTNSYRRLVPGYEAPVNLAWSLRNRSAACRIPMYSDSPKAKRVEFRCPDPSCNPYISFAAMLMAGLDGIRNKIEPGDPIDKNIYDLPPEEAAEIRQVPGSLDAALAALEADHDFLLEGDVFSPDLISTYIDYKRSVEIDPVRLRPHPYEYFLYYDL
mgnify:CR=1 FL=1